MTTVGKNQQNTIKTFKNVVHHDQGKFLPEMENWFNI